MLHVLSRLANRSDSDRLTSCCQCLYEQRPLHAACALSLVPSLDNCGCLILIFMHLDVRQPRKGGAHSLFVRAKHELSRSSGYLGKRR